MLIFNILSLLKYICLGPGTQWHLDLTHYTLIQLQVHHLPLYTHSRTHAEKPLPVKAVISNGHGMWSQCVWSLHFWGYKLHPGSLCLATGVPASIWKRYSYLRKGVGWPWQTQHKNANASLYIISSYLVAKGAERNIQYSIGHIQGFHWSHIASHRLQWNTVIGCTV